MTEVEVGEKRDVREITEDIDSVIYRLMYALRDGAQQDTAKKSDLKGISDRLTAIKDHIWGLADTFVGGSVPKEDKVRKGESYVAKLIFLIEELYDDSELWDSLPDNIRTYEGDSSDVERAEKCIRDWSDPTSQDYKDNFTHYQTGEVLVSEQEILEMVDRQRKYVQLETVGQPKVEVRNYLKKLASELEGFYVAASSRSPERRRN